MFPLVTIAIPTFNRADSYLRSALCCATGQTYPNLEIIVSDNCSSDNTSQLVGTFEDPRIRYFRHDENIGANNNFNFCLSQAKGQYFLLYQDDDLIDNDFIATCMEKGDPSAEAGIIRTGTRIIDSQGRVLSEQPNLVGGLSTEDFFLGWFSGKTSHYLCSTLFNTARLQEIGGFGTKHNLFQDVSAEVQLAARFGRRDIPDVKASFRRHHAEMTFAANVFCWCEDSLMLLDLMCELASVKKEEIRREGLRFFARLNYRRAVAVRSHLKRLSAYMTVYREFHYRYLPPLKHFVLPLYAPLRGTYIHSALRSIKRQIYDQLHG